MFMALAKGQEDLKALMIKDKKKKIKIALEFATPSNEGDNQEEKTKEEYHNLGSDEEDVDYAEEQYPPADDKYKQLEDRLNAMEIQRVPGLDFEELGLVSGVVIPQKFKVPVFAKYDKFHVLKFI